jgi:hypothetical protein
LKENDPTLYKEYRDFDSLRKSASVSIASEKHPQGHEVYKQYQREYGRKNSHDSQEESSSSHRQTTGQLRLTQSEETRRQRIKEEDEKALRDRGLEPDSW